MRVTYSLHEFRTPYEAELDRLWSTTWYKLEEVEGYLEEAAAKKLAEERCIEHEWSTAYIARRYEATDFFLRKSWTWGVFQFVLVPVAELRLVDEETLEAFLLEAVEGPDTHRREIELQAQYRWKRDGCSVGYLVRTEALEKAELTRRRLERSQKRAAQLR